VVSVAVAVVAAVVAASGRRQVQPGVGGPAPRDSSVAYRRARRHATATALLSWGVALVVALPFGGLLTRGDRLLDGAPGLGVALLPTTFGLTLLAIAAVGDTVTVDDERLRRVSARRVLAGAQLVIAGTLSGVLTYTGIALRNAATSTYGWSDGTQSVSATLVAPGVMAAGVVAAVLGVAVAIAGIVVTMVALAQAATEAGTAPVGAPVAGPAVAGPAPVGAPPVDRPVGRTVDAPAGDAP